MLLLPPAKCNLYTYSGEWPTTSHDYNQSVPTNRFYGSQPSSTQPKETDYWRPALQWK